MHERNGTSLENYVSSVRTTLSELRSAAVEAQRFSVTVRGAAHRAYVHAHAGANPRKSNAVRAASVPRSVLPR